MTNPRTDARITGVLFILGTVPVVVAMSLWGRSIDSPDYLSLMSANATNVLLCALSVVVMGLSCAGIGLSLFRVLEPHGAGKARAVMGFRLAEGTIQILSAVGMVALLELSREFAKAGSPPGSFFRPLGAAIKAAYDWVGNGAYLFPWCIAACIYYSVFYRTRLLPRWLSLWGFAGLALMLASSLGAMFGLIGSLSAVQMLLNLPILAQELVLAAWLIVVGYDPKATARREA